MKLEPSYRYRCEVTRVIDGDTLIVDIDLGLHVWLRGTPLRLAGIDAPDKEPRKSEATAWLRAWIAAHAPLGFLVETQKTEKYGRWLAKLYSFDAASHEPVCVNVAIFESGYAIQYDGGKR